MRRDNRKEEKEYTGNARKTEAIRILKTDPAAYFESTRRFPFGFVKKSETDSENDSE